MTTDELCAKWGLTPDEVEDLRDRHRGVFHTVVRDRFGNVKEATSDHNIVTNEGLNHVLTSTLDGGTQIGTWRIALSKTSTAPAASMTYATPSYTEIAAAEVTNTVRVTWQGGTVASQSVDNSTSGAKTYTASTSFTAYGAGLVGGGSASSTIANTTSGGTLYSYSKFASSKAMTNTDTIDITYTFTSANST